MNYFDVKDIENNRPAHEGTSITDDDMYKYVTTELERLGNAIAFWNNRNLDSDDAKWYKDTSGIENSGHCFANSTFCCLAYDWNEGPLGSRDLNFYHFASGCDITWYKYYTRGLYIHTENTLDIIASHELTNVINDCIDSLATTTKNEWEWTKEGEYGWY